MPDRPQTRASHLRIEVEDPHCRSFPHGAHPSSERPDTRYLAPACRQWPTLAAVTPPSTPTGMRSCSCRTLARRSRSAAVSRAPGLTSMIRAPSKASRCSTQARYGVRGEIASQGDEPASRIRCATALGEPFLNSERELHWRAPNGVGRAGLPLSLPGRRPPCRGVVRGGWAGFLTSSIV